MRGKSAEARRAHQPHWLPSVIQRVAEAAKMPFPIHPHMLRHACGFKLANDGHDTRGFRPIASRTFAEANEACESDQSPCPHAQAVGSGACDMVARAQSGPVTPQVQPSPR
jgi:hypothetical protein